VLGDWYHAEHSVLIKQFLSISDPGGAEPIPGLLSVTFFASANQDRLQIRG
jgi:iron transport multicopper oxidase